MDSDRLFRLLILGFFALGCTCPSPLYGQTVLSGTVIDAKSNEPLSYATVGFQVQGKGSITDTEGRFLLLVPDEPDTLFAVFLGYEDFILPIDPDTLPEKIQIKLNPNTLALSTVEVAARKERYRRKGNPAVELIRQVIKNKKRNQPQNQPYYSYDEYEKVEVGLTNLSENFTQRKIWKGYRFIFDYIDSTAYEKPVLPLFFQESTSSNYFRAKPKYKVEVQTGLKVTKPDKIITDQTIKDVVNRINQKVDIYQDRIRLFELDFISPIADIAPGFYRFYLGDTVLIDQQRCVTLDFVPSNPFSFGFAGSMYILLDGSYQVQGVKINVPETVNINFISRLTIQQHFAKVDSLWVVSRDELAATVEVSPTILGLQGKKTSVYSNHSFDPVPDQTVYQHKGQEVILPSSTNRTDTFWNASRPIPLSQREEGIYVMVDSLNNNRAFNRLINVVKAAGSGHFNAGPFRIGSLYSLISYNTIEGIRTRLGIQTNEKFHNHIRLGGYAAYGFTDRRVKYGAQIEYSFDKELSIAPRHFLSFSIQDDNEFPGQFTSFLPRDNIVFSYQIGQANKMLDFRYLRLRYHKEFSRSFGMDIQVEHREQRPVGAWEFQVLNDEEDQNTVDRIKTTTTQFSFFFAPKAKWVETQNYRYIIPNAHPAFSLDYRIGFDGLFGGEHQFHHLIFGVRQRLFLGAAGFAFFDIRLGKLWGNGVPYPLVHIAESNQTIAFASRSFNLMNFMEFVGDEHASLMVEYQLNGLILNRIPLIKKLNLREVVGFKLYYGRMTSANDPNQNPGLIQYPVNENGQVETYSINGTPYMEFSVGLHNIFKVIRIDYVHRLNYLDHPNLPSLFGLKGAGIRLGLQLQF